MSGTILLLCAIGYLSLLLILSYLTGRQQGNESFFTANRSSRWWMVSFGMVGASISGVTFVSVPGMVAISGMTYLQMCMGFLLGYAAVAFVLLPIYYRLNLTSIYTYLNHRFNSVSYYTGASIFLVSKLVGASIRLYLVSSILQLFIFDPYGIPFWVSSALLLGCIWLYTQHNGIRTLVWSDCVQTLILLTALVLIILKLNEHMGFSWTESFNHVWQHPQSQIFNFNNPISRSYFWKQFLSGIFVVIVMTGLDQDAMQKNLTCRTLRKSQLNMCVNGLLYTPVNFIFLYLGILMMLFVQTNELNIPIGDQLLPTLCKEGYLGAEATLYFTLGIIAAAFSSADSAITSLTTNICVDLFRKPQNVTLRKWVHPCVAILFWLIIMWVEQINSTSVIDAVYTACSYTYGPLLGLFAFGLLTKRVPSERWVVAICVVSPLLTYSISCVTQQYTGYTFGYELLMLNGLLTFLGLYASSAKFGAHNTGCNSYV